MKAKLNNLFKQYIFSIKKTDNIAILYHTDCDGVCSCAIIKKAIKYLTNKEAFVFCQKHGKIAITQDTIKLLKQKKINKFISVDMAIDQDAEMFRKIEEFAECLIIDHHIKKTDLSSPKTTFIKASDYEPDIEPSKNPASKLCFNFANNVIKDNKIINDLKFISKIGISGDCAYDFWANKGFLEKQEKPKIQKIDHILSSFFSATGNFDKIVDIMATPNIEQKANKIIVENKEICKYYFAVQKEIETLIDKINENAFFIKDKDNKIKLVFWQIKSKFNIKSILSNKLSFENYPGATVIVIQNGHFSARNQSFKISMNDLIKSAIKNISNASGGGHIPAAGGVVPKNKVDEFRENIVGYLC